MTNVEAIETLRANYPDACYALLREAIDVAIKALQRKPLKYLGECICVNCWTLNCDGCMLTEEVQ